jgi:hypothetical protein
MRIVSWLRKGTNLFALIFLLSISLAYCAESSANKKKTQEAEEDDESLNPENMVLLSSEPEVPDTDEPESQSGKDRKLLFLGFNSIELLEFFIITDEEIEHLLHSKTPNEVAEVESESGPPAETSKLTGVFAEFTPEKQIPGYVH